jgi:AraC family transcriptional regulator, ethanolamine operon transcriptional activator
MSAQSGHVDHLRARTCEPIAGAAKAPDLTVTYITARDELKVTCIQDGRYVMSDLTLDADQVRVRSLEFDDMDAMAHTMVGSHMDFVPLQSGKFHGRVCQIDVDGLSLRRISEHPHLKHGAIGPERIALQLLLRSAASMTINGSEFGRSHLAVLPGDMSTHAIFPVEHERIGIVIRKDDLDRMIESYGAPPLPQNTLSLLHLSDAQVNAMSSAFSAMTDFAQRLPNLFAVPGLGPAIADECRGLLMGALSDVNALSGSQLQTRDMLRQIRGADEFLQSHINRPIYTEELCTALGVTARQLHQSFAAVYGMSPHAYLKRRRLILVHRALRSNREVPAMVKSIALSHGFWHLSHFGQEYAAMFAETPSATLGKGGGRAVRSAA